MQPTQLFADDEAVSPVIGVILMVAITVILAAVIATFVLGLGDQLNQVAPTTSFSFDYDEGEVADAAYAGADGRLTIIHDGGDTIEAHELYVRGTVDGNDDGPWSDSGTGTSSYGVGSDITGGMTIEVDVSRSDSVRVVYEPEHGGNSAVLQRWDGPDA